MSSVVHPRLGDGLQRRHAVVLHADIADYSRLMADDEAATVATVRVYQRLVDDAVGGSGGVVVNFVGDSFMAVFDDARHAMQAAIRVCGNVREHNRPLDRTRRMYFRLGLDAGEIVIADDGRYFGDPLNVAARIQAIAEVGGINVTEAVFRALDEPALRLVGLGPRRLKNIPGMVRVYRLAGVGGEVDRRPTDDGADPIVALLPTQHADVSPDRDIAAALRMDLLRAMVKLPGLRVVDGDPDSDDVPRPSPGDGAARYVLQSGVVRGGTRLRAYAELLETHTMNPVWVERWDGDTDDIFALQDAVTADTVRAIEVELVVGQPAMIYHSVLDADARDAVYRGWYQMMLGTRAGWQNAARRFTSVTAAHPDAATGHALSAFALWWGATQGLSSDPERDLARAAMFAARGVELDDDTGLSHMVVAALRLHSGDDLSAALADAQVALVRRPTCDITHGLLGSVQRYLGDWQAAVDACNRALELGPQPQRWFRSVLASAYYVGERYHDAAELSERLVDRDPHDLDGLLVLTAAQQALGLTRRARATGATLTERFPDLRRDQLTRRHPFRDRGILDRWVAHLAAAGVP